MRDFPPEISTFYSAPGEKTGPAPDTRTPAASAPVVPEDAVAPDPADDRGRGAVAAPAHARPLDLRQGDRRRDRPRVGGRDPEVGRSPAAGHADRRLLRDRHAHPDRAQLADRALRDHEDGDPQGRADGPRPATSYADGRGAQRRLRRLRRVRRAHRDRLPLRLPADLVPRGRVHRAQHLTRARRPDAARRAGPRRCRAASAAPAAPQAADRARPQLRPHLDGHRHRRRAAHPARHRRRADLRPQLRPPVAAGPRGRRRCRHVAGGHRGRRRALLRRLHRAAGVARQPAGDLRRPGDRPADQLPGLRAVHDLPDPDLLRARAEDHPGHGLGAQGGGDLRGAAALARPGREHRCSRTTPTSTTSSPASWHATAS